MRESPEHGSGAWLRTTAVTGHPRSHVANLGEITHGAELRFIAVNDGPGEVGSPPRCDQDEKRWFQNSSLLPETLVLGKRDLNS